MSNVTINDYASNCQEFLCWSQAIPAIGPVIVSPIKAIVSLAQIVVGVAVTVFSRIIAGFAGLAKNHSVQNRYKKYSEDSLKFTLTGSKHLLYAALNIITLGCFGLLERIHSYFSDFKVLR